MITYKDMIFCEFKDCKTFKKCARALTDKVKADAERWMKNAPIDRFLDKPKCYRVEK